MKSVTIKALLLVSSLLGSWDSTASGNHDEHEENKKKVIITDAIADKFMIRTEVVGPGMINEQLKVYGKTVNDPSQVSHIRARFPGTVESVNVQIGDVVKSGNTLAHIESNESLKKYPVKALMSGVIVARHANPGEMALDQVLFTVADFEKIWAEFQVFPGQLNQIKSGQQVTVSGAGQSVISKIEHIIPSQDEKPYSLARVLIDNQTGGWATGLLVSGNVNIKSTDAALVVNSQAIQLVDGKPMVFVKNGSEYTAHAIEVGRSDGQLTEVLSGLEIGDEYVTQNSYLFKADLEKAGASHDH